MPARHGVRARRRLPPGRPGRGRPIGACASSDYFIDKYEVSNQEFKEFITAGGYVKREFWTHPFVKDGRTLSWEEAMQAVRRSTGLPGPRDVVEPERSPKARPTIRSPTSPGTRPRPTRHFAASSCRPSSSGRRRPATANTGRGRRGRHAVGRVLSGRRPRRIAPTSAPGTLAGRRARVRHEPVRRLQHGRERRGVDANDSSDGFIATGGAWGDPTYTFAQYGGRPGFFSSNKLGLPLRAARRRRHRRPGQRRGIELDAGDPGLHGDVAAATFSDAGRRPTTTTRPRSMRASKRRSRRPSGSARRSRSTAPNGERAIAYLYLPHHVAAAAAGAPLSCRPATSNSGFRSLTDVDGGSDGAVHQGRPAVFGVVLKGYIERLEAARDYVAARSGRPSSTWSSS